MRPEWFPDWSGQVAAIVAGGESVTQENVDKLRGRCRVAVVNNSCELAPWADVLYAADRRWWDVHPDGRKFAGLKVTPDADAARQHRLHLIRLIEQNDPAKNDMTIVDLGVIARGGNGGFQLTNLVMQFGVRRILWLGFDCRGDHWHGKHDAPLHNPSLQRLAIWAATFDTQSKRLRRMGVEIINCSDRSALQAYPCMSVESALRHFEQACVA